MAGKCLKAALSVVKVEPHQHTQEQVESSGEYPALERLALELKRRIKPARANGHVCAIFNRREQFPGFRNWRGEVSIGKQQHLSSRVQHAIPYRISLALIAGILN